MTQMQLRGLHLRTKIVALYLSPIFGPKRSRNLIGLSRILPLFLTGSLKDYTREELAQLRESKHGGFLCVIYRYPTPKMLPLVHSDGNIEL